MLGIIVGLIILIGVFALYAFTKEYAKDELVSINKKEYKLYQLMPTTLYLMDKILKTQHFSKRDQDIKEQLELIYGKRETTKRLRFYKADKLALIILIIFASGVLGLIIGLQDIGAKQLLKGNRLARPSYNEGSKTYSVNVKIKTDKGTIKKSLQIPVDEQQLSKSEVNEYFDRAEKYLKKAVLGENKTLKTVQYPLKLITQIPNTKLDISWKSNLPEIIDEFGQINYDKLDNEGKEVKLTAKITHEEEETQKSFFIKVFPAKIDLKELIDKELKLLVNNINEKDLEKSTVKLPKEINNGKVKLLWENPKSNTGIKFIIFGWIIAGVLYFLKEQDLKKQVDIRNRALRLDFPEFISKLTLLISAGMTVSKAWQKIAIDYQRQRENDLLKQKILYEEVVVTYYELQGGVSELAAYEQFGKRCKLPEFMKFSLIVIQNIKKGTNTLLDALTEQSREAWEKRKEVARLLGEQASTKLLLPMVLMMIIVLVILMVPALMSFNL